MKDKVVMEMSKMRNTTPMVLTIQRRETPLENMAILLSALCSGWALRDVGREPHPAVRRLTPAPAAGRWAGCSPQVWALGVPAVAQAPDGDNVLGVGGLFLHLHAQAPDVHVHDLFLAGVAGAPHVL